MRSTAACVWPRDVFGNSYPSLFKDHDRANLNGTECSRRNFRGVFDGLIQIIAIENVVATQLFLGFGEGTVGVGPEYSCGLPKIIMV